MLACANQSAAFLSFVASADGPALPADPVEDLTADPARSCAGNRFPRPRPGALPLPPGRRNPVLVHRAWPDGRRAVHWVRCRKIQHSIPGESASWPAHRLARFRLAGGAEAAEARLSRSSLSPMGRVWNVVLDGNLRGSSHRHPNRFAPPSESRGSSVTGGGVISPAQDEQTGRRGAMCPAQLAATPAVGRGKQDEGVSPDG